MPSRSELPGEIKRKKLTRALQRLGFVIDTAGGDGSHYKIIWPVTGKSITVPQKIRKDVLHYLLADIEKFSGKTWDDIKEEL